MPKVELRNRASSRLEKYHRSERPRVWNPNTTSTKAMTRPTRRSVSQSPRLSLFWIFVARTGLRSEQTREYCMPDEPFSVISSCSKHVESEHTFWGERGRRKFRNFEGLFLFRGYVFVHLFCLLDLGFWYYVFGMI